MTHGGQVDLLDHLPGGGAEALADADEDLVDLPHPGSDVERDRKAAGERSKRDFRFRPDTEPHDHHREEDDLRRRTEIVEIWLERVGQKSIAAEQKAHRETCGTSDCERCADLRSGDAEVEI